MIACINSEKARPPIPLPVAVVPVATLRLLANHCEIAPTLPAKRKPIPTLKNTAWVRNRCQMSVEKEAAMSTPASITTSPP